LFRSIFSMGFRARSSKKASAMLFLVLVMRMSTVCSSVRRFGRWVGFPTVGENPRFSLLPHFQYTIKINGCPFAEVCDEFSGFLRRVGLRRLHLAGRPPDGGGGGLSHVCPGCAAGLPDRGFQRLAGDPDAQSL